ncbi:MAG: hypothetical protein ABH871_06940 [Pseudomonadota bacterium]
MANEKITTKLERRRVSRCAEVPVKNLNAETLKQQLNTWLDNRTCWNHEDWLTLLGDLRERGYSDLIDTPKGQEVIGRYLEHNKKCASC